MHFTIFKNNEEFIKCGTKTELYIEWDKLNDNLFKDNNFEWSVCFYMQSKTKDDYCVKRVSRIGEENYNQFDRDEANRLKENKFNY